MTPPPMFCAPHGRPAVSWFATAVRAAVFAANERQHFNIDAGSLDKVLSRFGVQAGISMAGGTTLTTGKNSKGLKGDFTTETELTQLLDSTGLSYQRRADGSYELYPTNGRTTHQLRRALQNLTDSYCLDPLAPSFLLTPGRTLRMGLMTNF